MLCANGDVRATTDGGQRWPKAYTVKRALALTVAEGGTGVVVQSRPVLQGGRRGAAHHGQAGQGRQCVTGPTIDGRISVSNAGNEWWLLGGAQVFTAEEPARAVDAHRQDAEG